jgi:hypothetical protein
LEKEIEQYQTSLLVQDLIQRANRLHPIRQSYSQFGGHRRL